MLRAATNFFQLLGRRRFFQFFTAEYAATCRLIGVGNADRDESGLIAILIALLNPNKICGAWENNWRKACVSCICPTIMESISWILDLMRGR
jgi:hypothetical protein